MKLGYCRISDPSQNLSLQYDALHKAGCDKIFEDFGFSGKIDERKGLHNALAALNQDDMLIVWKLDRLGRSLKFLCEIIEDLHKRGIGFYSISDGIDTTTPSGKLMFHIIGSIAEFESALISERTVAGMNAARRRGKRVGRLCDDLIIAAYSSFRSGDNLKLIAEDIGCSVKTLQKGFERLNLPVRKTP